MIDKIENVIIEKLENFLNQKLGSHFDFSSSFYDSAIQIDGVENKPDGIHAMFIRAGIHKENKQVYIANLFIPFPFRHQNIGKDMISIVFKSALEFGYETFLVEMTESFYERMVIRGAVKCNVPDILHITSSTRLN
jgi:hypothetical protein